MGMISFNLQRKQAEAKKIKEPSEIDELIQNIDSANATEVKKVAKHLDIEYTNKPDTVQAIIELIDKG